MADFNEITEDVVRQRNWDEDELQKQGYKYYTRKKQVVMARKVPDEEAPKTIITAQGDELIAEKDYIICYYAGDEVYDTLEEYDHWPVAPTIFAKTYKRWDDDNWHPSPSEAKLQELGCKPYYKFIGVWAKKVDESLLMQSLEHDQPVSVEPGKYIAIGADGEPYSMGENTLHARYETNRRRIGEWFKRIFGG